MSNPYLIDTPFAINGDKNVIQDTERAEPNNPTWSEGWDATTSTPINSGGKPPKREDFNGVFYAVTDNLVHQAKGLGYEFDSAFATKIGGYPLGAKLRLADGSEVVSTSNNNTNNPASNMTGWIKPQGGINSVESIDDLIAIANPRDGQSVRVNSYHAGKNKGGSYRVYRESRKSENDSISCINGWVIVLESSEIDLYQCGLLGDGVADDRQALQNAVRVASANKLNLKGNPSDVYLIKSLSNENGFVDLISCNTNYLVLDLNGSTIKIANNLGDYRAIFGAIWVHSKFKLTNGVIDQNTTNNPPLSPVLWSNTNGQRNIVNAFSVPHEYFEVSNIKMLDVLGVWEVNTTQANRINITNNDIYYSSLNTTHTDRTSVYVLPRLWAKVNNNRFYGDTFGNATTAVELHGSNCEFIGNTVIGFRSPVFITPNAQEENSNVYSNIYCQNNIFTSCQNGVILWIESDANLNRPMQNIHVENNNILIDSRLITDRDIGLKNGTGVGFLGSDLDCKIDGLYIQGNKISYNYNAENIQKDSDAGIDLTSFMTNASFEWKNFYVVNNIIEYAPCDGIAIGNTIASTHTSSISNVKVYGNTIINCGLSRIDSNSFALKVFNPSKLSCIEFKDNTLIETSDASTWMKFISVGVGDGTASSGVRFEDNITNYSRSSAVNDMYRFENIYIDEVRYKGLDASDVNTKAKLGSKFTNISTGQVLVQSSPNASTPVWKELVY